MSNISTTTVRTPVLSHSWFQKLDACSPGLSPSALDLKYDTPLLCTHSAIDCRISSRRPSVSTSHPQYFISFPSIQGFCHLSTGSSIPFISINTLLQSACRDSDEWSEGDFRLVRFFFSVPTMGWYESSFLYQPAYVFSNLRNCCKLFLLYVPQYKYYQFLHIQLNSLSSAVRSLAHRWILFSELANYTPYLCFIISLCRSYLPRDVSIMRLRVRYCN